jgi:hypothetical protein
MKWFQRLIKRFRPRPDPVDQLEAEVARRAFKTGNIVVANMDEKGNIVIKEIPRDKPKGEQ